MPHHAVEDGQVGMIILCKCRPGGPLHGCLVQFDADLAWPVSVDLGTVVVPLRVRFYALDELELVD